MKNLKEKIYNLFKILKKSVEKFPLTMILILILTSFFTVCLDNELIEEKILKNISLFIVIFASSTFLIETLLEDQIKKRIIYYIITAIWAIMLTFATNVEKNILNMTNEVFLFRIEKIIICYLITTIILGIYYNYKKSNKNFENYVTTTFVSLFKTSLIYGILALGIAMVTAVFIYLILDKSSYILVARMEILLLGIYYIPTILYSFYNQEEEIGKFAKIVIKYVLGTLVMIAFVIIYMYIIKIIFLRNMPSNQIFRILSVLFLTGLPIWTMISSFKEESTFDKINKKLPLLFIPFIFLQIYSIAIRIQANGITKPRYLCLMLVIFEIVYTIIYLKNKENVSKILLLFILLTVISTIAPYINMFNISNISQYNNLKIYKQKSEYTDEDKSKIYGAYYYLKYSVDGEKYLQEYLTEDEKDEILKFKSSNKQNNQKDLYANTDLEYIKVEGYNKLYIIDTYKYKYDDNEETIDEIFSNINFYIQGSKSDLKLNILSLINEYISNEEHIDEYFKEKNELELDNNRKLLLKHISIEYDDKTKKVNYYNISGYLLEK